MYYIYSAAIQRIINERPGVDKIAESRRQDFGTQQMGWSNESIPDRREPYRRVPLGRVHLDERRLDEVQ